MSLGRYSKFAVAIGGVLSLLGQVLSDGAVSTDEIGLLVSAIAAAVLVFVVPNASQTEGV
jgi:hypothetical protein